MYRSWTRNNIPVWKAVHWLGALLFLGDLAAPRSLLAVQVDLLLELLWVDAVEVPLMIDRELPDSLRILARIEQHTSTCSEMGDALFLCRQFVHFFLSLLQQLSVLELINLGGRRLCW